MQPLTLDQARMSFAEIWCLSMTVTRFHPYDSLRSLVPRPLRKSIGVVIEDVRARTSQLRFLPAFLIVGGQRCGTNSLYEYLIRHPNVARALPDQEVHFFDCNFHKGLNWYRGHFPTRARAKLTKLRSGSGLISGESSPYYMFHPFVAARIAESLPGIKLLVLLRNPVDRAYSHYHHERARGHETLSFEEAVAREPVRLRGEVDRIRRDPTYNSFNHQHFSYLARGEYLTQLQTLFSRFPRENILVLISEQLFADPAEVHARALRFLGLRSIPLSTYVRHNPGRYDDMDPGVRSRLVEHFNEPNARLFRFLGLDDPWEE
jgi:hypothetical protein